MDGDAVGALVREVRALSEENVKLRERLDAMTRQLVAIDQSMVEQARGTVPDIIAARGPLPESAYHAVEHSMSLEDAASVATTRFDGRAPAVHLEKLVGSVSLQLLRGHCVQITPARNSAAYLLRIAALRWPRHQTPMEGWY